MKGVWTITFENGYQGLAKMLARSDERDQTEFAGLPPRVDVVRFYEGGNNRTVGLRERHRCRGALDGHIQAERQGYVSNRARDGEGSGQGDLYKVG